MGGISKWRGIRFERLEIDFWWQNYEGTHFAFSL